MPRYQPRPYSLVQPPQPQPIDIAGNLLDLARLSEAGEQIGERRRKRETERIVTSIAQKHKGDKGKMIPDLESQGLWDVARRFKAEEATIKKAQHEEIVAGMTRAREGFETATRYLQGVEAEADPAKRRELFAAIRPQLVEALPNFNQYIPQRLDDDPGFIGRAIPFGLSAADVATRRQKAVEALDKVWQKQGDQLTRDNLIMKSVGEWVKDADTGKDVEEILSTAATLYGASDAVRTRVGEVPAGPLPAEWKTSALSRLATEPTTAPETPKAGTFEAFLGGVARTHGVPVDQLPEKDVLSARRRWQEAGRAPKEPKTTEEVQALARAVLANPAIYGDLTDSAKSTIAVQLQQAGFTGFGSGRGLSADAKASAEKWRFDRLKEVEAEKAFDEDEDTTKARQAIEDVYQAILGKSPARTPRAQAPSDAPSEQPGPRRTTDITLAPMLSTVKMRTPDGRLLDVPAAQVEEAKRRGATVVR